MLPAAWSSRATSLLTHHLLAAVQAGGCLGLNERPQCTHSLARAQLQYELVQTTNNTSKDPCLLV